MSWFSDLRSIAGRALRAARTEAYWTRVELRGGSREHAPGDDVSAISAAGVEVLLYFADPPENLYQIRQWLPILERLNELHPVGILTRDGASHAALARETQLPVALVRAFRDLEPFYTAVGAKVCLYVNAHPRNFQSLAFADLLHVHLNHGESDKVSMASNQAKAYDYVVVAGDAAVERYRRNLLRYDGANLVKLGRPQIDMLHERQPAREDRATLVYAPTWEGGRATMDYSSVASMGLGIARALLGTGHRVVYRPHPKTGSEARDAAAADASIRQAVRESGGEISEDEPLEDVLARADLLVADVSSVMLEFLPLDRPAFVTTPPARRGVVLPATTSMTDIVHTIGPDDLAGLPARIAAVLEHDPLVDERRKAIAWYFGDTTPGRSLQRFLEGVSAMVAERDRLLAEKREGLVGEHPASERP